MALEVEAAVMVAMAELCMEDEAGGWVGGTLTPTLATCSGLHARG